jgi:hypothetical protein
MSRGSRESATVRSDALALKVLWRMLIASRSATSATAVMMTRPDVESWLYGDEHAIIAGTDSLAGSELRVAEVPECQVAAANRVTRLS